jgi:quinol-cytochrome oxidoreductase complex cytochrome b subunit
MSQRSRLQAARSRVAGWLGQFRADVKASLDPGLLRILRLFGLAYGPIHRRVPIDQAFREVVRNPVPSHVGWAHLFGWAAYLLFMLLVVSGVLLALYYRPAVGEAYASIQHIVSNVRMGWLMRDVHVWSASLIVIAVLAHMARVFFSGAYQPPRESVWLVGLFLLLLILAFGATGYLLPWDQWSYWTVTEALGTLGVLPIAGSFLVRILTGADFVWGATLSRFFAIHVIILPWFVFGLLGFHISMARRHGPAPPARGALKDDPGVPFYPTHLMRNFVVGVLVTTAVITLAALYPRPVGDPANALQLPEEIVSTWVVVDVTRALLHYLGTWGLGLVMLLGLSLALIPLFDRRGGRRLRERPLAVALTSAFFLVFLVAWVVGRQLHAPPAPELLTPAPEVVVPTDAGTPIPELGPEPVRPAPPPDPRPGPPPGGGEGP